MLTTNWDPKTIENQGPSASCLLRVKQDIAEIKADPLPGIYVSPEKNDLTKFHAIVVGPSGTPYEGGFFQFFMKCSRQLPDAATPRAPDDHGRWPGAIQPEPLQLWKSTSRPSPSMSQQRYHLKVTKRMRESVEPRRNLADDYRLTRVNHREKR
ncbi:hypothetical protein HPB49_024327 [Dermacentor silvarum]|uniref:Uncharacterized protein n=1 Tax=Dermacentor silvarum TaxID=543639 RepID=A0ACB8DM00_DERSI|nr:hypothetical protein HPB49_024327 [Dermacentor silvarum]